MGNVVYDFLLFSHTARGASLSRGAASDEQARGREDNPRDE